MVEDLEDVNQNIVMADFVPLESQVAGHTFKKGSCVGMLRHKDGYVLKPVIARDEKGEKEVGFYEEIQNSVDPVVKELKRFVPRYFGTTYLRMNKQDLKWIVLENVTHGFAQPCIMDVKIGYQTWDPFATDEKRRSEENKYKESKRDLSFCIPGFHVYKLGSGELLKFDRDYGKTLNGETIKTSLRTFLNADSGLSRTLVLQLLTKLWKILRWFRIQKKYNFYSSSLLLAYDASRLKRSDRASSHTANGIKPPVASGSDRAPSPSSGPSSPPLQNWHAIYDNVCRTHSIVNNYDKDLETKRENYSLLLKDLVGQTVGSDPSNEEWVSVHMIDFAHVFHSNTDELDKNYLDGLQNLVNIFEEFLTEVD